MVFVILALADWYTERATLCFHQVHLLVATSRIRGLTRHTLIVPQITSKEHFDDVVSRAAGADDHEGYEDAQGNWRVPHKLMMVQVHAGWCRVCKGLQPKLLKLIIRHPEVLCCKINKTHNEASGALTCTIFDAAC